MHLILVALQESVSKILSGKFTPVYACLERPISVCIKTVVGAMKKHFGVICVYTHRLGE